MTRGSPPNAGRSGACRRRCVDRVGKGIDRFGVSVGILDGGVDRDAVHCFSTCTTGCSTRGCGSGSAQRSNAALEIEGHLAVRALVHQVDRHAAGDKGHFAEALHQGLESGIHLALKISGSNLKVVRVPLSPSLGQPCRSLDRFLGIAALVALEVDLAVAADFDLAPFGKALTAETPTPCKPPETLYPPPPNLPPACRTVITTSRADFFICGCISTGMPRPLSSTVTLLSAWMVISIRSQDAGQGFIDRVIHHFINQVVQGFDVGAAHIHTGAAADGFQTFQHLDIFQFSLVPPNQSRTGF
jgi:hypothetical protein